MYDREFMNDYYMQSENILCRPAKKALKTMEQLEKSLRLKKKKHPTITEGAIDAKTMSGFPDRGVA